MHTLPRSFSLTPDQFAQVCAANPEAVLELAADGTVIEMTPAGDNTSARNSALVFRWRALSEAEREGFPPLCPDLVVELASPSDQLEPWRHKMASYISNGAWLGWHLVAITTPLSTRIRCHSGGMARSAESTTEANASDSGTTTTTVAAAGDLDSVGEGAAMPAVESRLIKLVELLLRESGNTEPFDAAAWVQRWLHRPNHAFCGAAPELYLHTPGGEALLSSLIGAMAAGSYM